MPNGFYGNSSNLIGLDSIFSGQFIPKLPAATYNSYQMPGNYVATYFLLDIYQLLEPILNNIYEFLYEYE